jgi:hypothetical protein
VKYIFPETSKKLFSRFWKHQAGQRPCMGFQISNIGLTPTLPAEWSEESDPSAFTPWYESKYRESLQIRQDTPWTAIPPAGLCHLGTIISPGERTISMDSQVFQNYLNFLQYLLTLSMGRFPVGASPMCGITDVLHKSARGGTDQHHARYRNSQQPADELTSSAMSIASGLKTLALSQNELLYNGQGEHILGFLNMWAPGPVFRYQEHQAASYSRDQYAECILPAVLDILAAFEYSVFYLHFSAYHLLEILLPLKEISAIEIFVNPERHSLTDIMPMICKIRESGKALILRGMLIRDEIELVSSADYLLLTKGTLNEAQFWFRYLTQSFMYADSSKEVTRQI